MNFCKFIVQLVKPTNKDISTILGTKSAMQIRGSKAIRLYGPSQITRLSIELQQHNKQQYMVALKETIQVLVGILLHFVSHTSTSHYLLSCIDSSPTNNSQQTLDKGRLLLQLPIWHIHKLKYPYDAFLHLGTYLCLRICTCLVT